MPMELRRKRGSPCNVKPQADPKVDKPQARTSSSLTFKLALPLPSSPDPITASLSDPSSIRCTSSPPTTTPTTTIPTTETSTHRLTTTQSEAQLSETRRQALRTLQANRYSHLAGVAEPDLNDPHEVRHFEVDSQGSLTFLLLDNGEAWRLNETGLESPGRGQMIVGRFYEVERIE